MVTNIKENLPLSPEHLNFEAIIQSVLNLTDAEKLAQVKKTIGEIPHPIYPSESPLLVRDEKNQVIEVKTEDGKSVYWSAKDGYSPEAKQQYIKSYESVASHADAELQSLLEINHQTAPQFLAQSLETYLDLLDHISQKHEFSTGHDRKHLSRDMSGTLEIFQDTYKKNICTHPSDLFCGAIGASHNNSVGLIPRYEDFAHLATHADVGALLAHNLYSKMFPDHPNLTKLISYTIMAHTHILKAREVKSPEGNLVFLPFFDELIAEEDHLVGFAPWLTRGGDRADMAGGVTQIGRHIGAMLDGKGEGKNISPDGNIDEVGKVRTKILIPNPDEPDTMMKHLEGYAISGLKLSPYSQHDSKSLVGDLVKKRSEQGAEIAEICRRSLKENPGELPSGLSDATLGRLKKYVAKVCEYPNNNRRAAIEEMINVLWLRTVTANPAYVHTWKNILDYSETQIRLKLMK